MTIQSTDQTEAADVINYLIDSQAATASATTQKVLTDDTTGESVAGVLVDLALTDDEQAQLIAAADASLTAILAARSSAASAADAAAGSSVVVADASATASGDASTSAAPVQS